MKYILRAPKPLILIDSGERLYCITGDAERDIVLRQEKLAAKSTYHAIDSTGESFSYTLEYDAMSPLTIKKQNTKKVIIELYNSRRPDGASEYIPKSLSNTKYFKVFTDIAALVLEENV